MQHSSDFFGGGGFLHFLVLVASLKSRIKHSSKHSPS